MNLTSYCCLFTILFTTIAFLVQSSNADCSDRSASNTVPFASKVQESPLIVIGTSLNKMTDPDVRNLFNVTFLVECILKGRPTQRFIQIVQAGSLLGRQSCQRLHVNRQYIVFLEPFFDGTYRPVDFEEIPYSTLINVVLEKTCGLSRTYPYTGINDTDAFSTNRCPPSVSIDCPADHKKIIATTLKTPPTTQKPAPTSTFTTTSMMNIFAQPGFDIALLAQFLAEHKNENISMAFLQAQTQKGLFSDDESRKNGIGRLSSNIIITLIVSSLFYAL